MVSFDSLRRSVSYAINTADFGTEEDAYIEKIICGVALYKLLENISAHDSSVSGSLNSLATSYLNTYVKSAQSMNGRIIAYAYIKKKIQEWRLDNFSKITQTQLNTLYEYYLNKSEIETFDTYYYKSEMYGVINIGYFENEKLSKIHSKIMSPIARYYSNAYGISISSVHIYDALGETINPGKVILFNINGVPDYKIVADIKGGKIGITQYLYDVGISEGHVKITTKM